jgi:hypothetical protein
MRQRITPASLAVLERLELLAPYDTGFSFSGEVGDELASHNLADDSARGLRITEEGREYLRRIGAARRGLRAARSARDGS